MFNSLNILCFHKLVIPRISLILFKNDMRLVPKPISQLFTKKTLNAIIGHSSSFHLSFGRGEAIYRSFSFHGINIWNYLNMHVPIDVSYLRFKKLTLSYLIANDIVYRIKQQIFYFLCKFLKHKIVYTQIASYTYVLYYICDVI